MTTTDEEIERATADAIAELIRHGGTAAQVEAMRAHFKARSEEAEQAANRTDGIPECPPQLSTRNQMVTVIPTNRLNWRSAAAGPSLHLDRRDTALLHVVKDKTYSNMWRIRSPDGSLSDMANLTRAKDAALHLALVILNRKPEAKEPAVAAPYSDYSALQGVRRHKPQITTPSSVAA